MAWWKAIIIGFCIYWGIFLVNVLLFVQFGLGYSFPKLANTVSDILDFPAGTGKNYNFLLSMIFWTVTFSVVIKVVNFYIHKIKA
ncbi:MAG: hypothetical protein PHW54_00745 [Candidatus Omnitrophica bacterium]|jgi:hypothetical protein|nr:hypothetical protein [Candidatus Omnitrophota bacterium]